jgi:phage-related protein
MSKPPVKPLEWVASSKKDLLSMPSEVVDVFGYALHLAQHGGKHQQAKPLKGFGSAGVLEVVEDDDDSTYRAVYTVRFGNAVMSCIVSRRNHTRAWKRPSRILT